MSNGPSNPFGGNGDRTVFLPNPGGRRPQTTPQPQNTQQPETPASDPALDSWSQATPPPPAPAPEARPVRAIQTVNAAPHDNKLLQAAQPLLLLLGRLRASLAHARPAALMEQVAASIELFESNARASGPTAEHLAIAKYAISATADDIVQNIPSEERHVWTQYSMLSRFFGERTGGVRFFQELERTKADPILNYDVLELQYACLALGFQGIHRTASGGQNALQQIQRNLYETLRRVRPRVQSELSARWRGQDIPLSMKTVRVPMWAVGATASGVLLSLYLAFRFMLAGSADAASIEIGKLLSDQPVTIQRQAMQAPPPPVQQRRSTQLERIRSALTAEISANQLDVGATSGNIYIRVGTFASFQSGQAQVLDSFKSVAGKVAATLEKEPGYIKIIGHTDNVKLASTRFESNLHLSQERAQAVARLLRESITAKERLQTEGKGSDQPISTNDTGEGRARNRRVEIIIPRDGT